MANRQYVGARYVPKFATPVEWNGTLSYEALTIVTHLGNSFTSKKPVPAGIDIGNTEYWVNTGNYNEQVTQYRQDVQRLESEFNDLSSYVDSKVTNAMTYDMATQRAKFKSGVLPIIADYIARALGGNCVTTPDANLAKVAFVYNNEKTYAGWLGRPTGANTYVGTDTKSVNGANYPVMYLDCSTFINLLTCGRDYEHTLNYFTTNGSGNTDVDYPSSNFKNLIWLCSERTPTDNDGWVFDWRSNTLTHNMLRLMDNAGNPGIQIQSYNNGIKNKITSAIANLQTGDILFGGLNANANYKTIVHCAMFIKSLDELNIVRPNLGFKTYNGATDNSGYIVEVSNSKGAVDYQDVVRITTLSEFLGTYDNAYAVYPMSTVETSSRKNMYYSREFTCWRFKATYSSKFNYVNNILFFEPLVEKKSVTRVSNTALAAGTDLNDIFNDVVATSSTSATAGLVNKPNDVTSGCVILKTYAPSWTLPYRVQELINFPLAGTTGAINIYRRYCTHDNKWSEWTKV